jgi:hypothetical protein
MVSVSAKRPHHVRKTTRMGNDQNNILGCLRDGIVDRSANFGC